MRHPEKALKWIVEILRKNEIPFQITGGFAARVYGSKRPLFDIDIDVPDRYIKEIASITKKYIIYGPQRYIDDAFDCLLMTLEYHGQRIDLSGSTSEKTFDKKSKKWVSSRITLKDPETREVSGMKIPLERRENLITYKKRIARKTDLMDINNISGKRIIDFPTIRQSFDYDCGAEAARGLLAYYGKDIREDKIMEISGTNKQTGTSVQGILKVLKKFKLNASHSSMTIDELKSHIDEKRPVMLAIQAWTKKKKTNWQKTWDEGHYVVAIGYDESKIYFRDPSSICITYLSVKEFEQRWHDKDAKGKKYINFGMVIKDKKTVYSHSKMTKMQ